MKFALLFFFQIILLVNIVSQRAFDKERDCWAGKKVKFEYSKLSTVQKNSNYFDIAIVNKGFSTNYYGQEYNLENLNPKQIGTLKRTSRIRVTLMDDNAPLHMFARLGCLIDSFGRDKTIEIRFKK